MILLFPGFFSERRYLEISLQLQQHHETGERNVCGHIARFGGGPVHAVLCDASGSRVSGRAGRTTADNSNAHVSVSGQESDWQCFSGDLTDRKSGYLNVNVTYN